MDLQYLKEFVILSEYLNFSQASEELYISQSVLSKHIHKLEKELGHSLFLRTSRKVQLTAFGEKYLVHAKEIVNAFIRSERAINDFLKSQDTTLTVGVIDNMQYFDVDKILSEYQRRYPEIKLKIYEDIEDNLYRRFRKGEINLFTVSVTDPSSLDYDYLPVFEGYLDVYCSCNHELAKLESITIEELVNTDVYLPAKGSAFSKMFEDIVKLKNLSTENFHYGNYGTNFIFIDSAIGVGLFPDYIMKKENRFKKIRLIPEIYHYGILAYRKNYILTRPERLFLKLYKEFIDKE